MSGASASLPSPSAARSVEPASTLQVTASSEAQARRWLTGRRSVVEFLLTGGATWFLFPLSWLLRDLVGLERSELAVGFLAFYAAMFVNNPHFAATYLLFYRNAKQRFTSSSVPALERLRYWLAGFGVPLILTSWSAWALGTASPAALGLLFELMFLLVGWHYTKQGFGVLSVLSARQGISLRPLERHAIRTHCYAGWAYAWANPAHGAAESSEKGVVYLGLARPALIEHVALAACVLSAGVVVVVLAAKWRRERKLPPLAALSGLLASIWPWSIFSSADPLLLYVIPGLHSLQYLYFVWLLKRGEAEELTGPPAFAGTVRGRLGVFAVSAVALAWLLFDGAPGLLDGALVVADAADTGSTTVSGALGPTPFLAAIVTSVNIHHYFMDAVIWRRENPETRYLVVKGDSARKA